MSRRCRKKGKLAEEDPPAEPAAVSRPHPAKSIDLSRTKLVCAGSVFLAALLLYSRTLAPGVTLVDSGELIVAARFAGVPHPPGFPLWVMLAHVASLAPFGNVAQRVNFASAVFAALTCGIVTQVITELLLIVSYRSKRRQRQDLLVLGPAVICGLLMACSRTLWSYATIAEVYALNSLLIVLVILLMLRWRRALAEKDGAASSDLWLYLAAFVFGLGLGVHHVTVGLILPSLALLVYGTRGRTFFTSRKLLVAALLAVTALVATYAYLPIAAGRAPLLNWGHTRTLTEIWWHVSGRQYQSFFSFVPQVIGGELAGFGRITVREFGPAWIPLTLLLAIAGFRVALRRDRGIFWFLALLIGANVAYGLCYEIAEDKDAYYLPTFISLVIAAGLGLRSLLEWNLTKAWQTLVVIFIALLLPTLALAGNWRFNDRSRYFIASDYVDNIVRAIAPGGLLLTLDWQVASPMFYTREVEQRRRDVKVIDVNLLRRSWYFDYLRQAYPELVARSERELDEFVAELRQWEQNPKAYVASAVLRDRIGSAFRKFWQALVTNESRVGPIYVTSEMASMAGGENEEISRWLVTRYRLLPRGLVIQLSQNPELVDPGDLHLETRGLNDGTLAFGRDDVVKVKILPVYTSMLVNRGRYLALLNQHARAGAAFEQALALDPDLEVARKGLRETQQRQRNR